MLCSHYRHWMYSIHPERSSSAPEARVSCRLCAQAAEEDLMTDISMSRTEDPVPVAFDRFRVKQMMCSFCYTVQPTGPACRNPECTAYGRKHRYYCAHCHLWEDNPDRTLFHCDKCGICRVGTAWHYRHCSKCNMCIPTRRDGRCLQIGGASQHFADCPPQDTHRCWGFAQSCAICYEDMAQSTDAASYLPCGHVFHQTCLQQCFMQGHIHCPVCKQSVLSDILPQLPPQPHR